MTIELLSTDEYDTLLRIQKDRPKLTFQNVGYQYIDRSTFSEEDKKADEEVQTILSKHIKDFRKFDNFRVREFSEELVIRFQYHWSAVFAGVGYITLRELLNGFDGNQIEEIKEG
jgi:hypothetical protein